MRVAESNHKSNHKGPSPVLQTGGTAVKERGILFKAEMVRAILDGRKTQTRRIMTSEACKQGVPGDRLWVRETWAENSQPGVYTYRADWAAGVKHIKGWRPSLLMPRVASRITLEITGVRAERLHDISENDAWAEGVGRVGRPLEALANLVTQFPKTNVGALAADDDSLFRFGEDRSMMTDYEKVTATTVRGCYAFLWESINGPGSWALNPWVWVIEFKKLEGA